MCGLCHVDCDSGSVHGHSGKLSHWWQKINCSLALFCWLRGRKPKCTFLRGKRDPCANAVCLHKFLTPKTEKNFLNLCFMQDQTNQVGKVKGNNISEIIPLPCCSVICQSQWTLFHLFESQHFAFGLAILKRDMPENHETSSWLGFVNESCFCTVFGPPQPVHAECAPASHQVRCQHLPECWKIISTKRMQSESTCISGTDCITLWQME